MAGLVSLAYWQKKRLQNERKKASLDQGFVVAVSLNHGKSTNTIRLGLFLENLFDCSWFSCGSFHVDSLSSRRVKIPARRAR